MVYIREAHALDSRSPAGGGSNPILEDPVTLLERKNVAKVCMTRLEIQDLPSLVDDMDDSVNSAYAAWPDRLYLVGKDGNIAYHGGRGPFGFLPGELEDAIRGELGLPARSTIPAESLRNDRLRRSGNGSQRSSGPSADADGRIE